MAKRPREINLKRLVSTKLVAGDRPMLTRLIPLLILSSALGVLGQDALEQATYTFGLEHVYIHGRITGVVDGDTINLLIRARQQIRVRIAFIDAP